MFKREEETIDTKPSRWPGHRQAARHHSPWQYVIMSLKSPTKNAFYFRENSYFHQDRTLKEVQRKTIFIKIAPIVKWLTSPTQNAFYLGKTAIFIKIAPIEKWVKKSNAKRVLLKENNHFHQDRPHHKMIEKVQRKTHFQSRKQPFSSRSPPS